MKEQPPLLNIQGECNGQETSPERCYVTPSENDHPYAPYFEGYITAYAHQHAGPPPDLNEPCNEDYGGAANAANEPHPRSYNFPNVSINSERRFPWQPDISFAVGNEGGLLRGLEKAAEEPGQSDRDLKPRSESSFLQHNLHNPPLSTPSNGRPPLTQAPYYTQNASEPIARTARVVRATTFKPFGGQFHDSESAKRFRKIETRGTRMPYRPPDSDSSILDIEQNRLRHVERIYNAMTRGDKARDNEKSIAMKRWVYGAYYKSPLVEAYSHKVLDCLLEQAKKGYRGWEHNDYVADDRKGEDEDRDVDCAARLDNVIRALEEEKTICEDVMNSACQIRMFVNAPKAYANRKYQNRVGNSKRGRPKDAEDDTAAKSSKDRRITLKPTTRARTSSSLLTNTRDVHVVSRTPDPPPQQPGAQPQYMTPPTNLIASPATLPRATPVIRHTGSFNSAQPRSFGVNHTNSMSPHPVLTPIQYQTTISKAPNSPFLPPPPLAQCHLSSPASRNVTRLSGIPMEAWPSMQAYDRTYVPPYPDTESFLDQPWAWPPGDPSRIGISSNLFEQNPDAAFLNFSQQSSELNEEQSFEKIWSNHHGIQQFPYHQSAESLNDDRD